MKMYPDEWQVKLTTGLVSAACVVAAMMLVGRNGFWPFMLSIIVATLVTGVFLVGWRMLLGRYLS